MDVSLVASTGWNLECDRICNMFPLCYRIEKPKRTHACFAFSVNTDGKAVVDRVYTQFGLSTFEVPCKGHLAFYMANNVALLACIDRTIGQNHIWKPPHEQLCYRTEEP